MANHEDIELTGMVISAGPVSDYNKRLVILTGEAGRITAFARGARKPGNRFMGNTEPFSFGRFKLIKGKDAYTLVEANISRHFEELRLDYDATVYGSYFLEIAEYYTRENMEAYEELNLIYASLLALVNSKFDRRLVRAIYEIKSLVIAGEFPGIPNDRAYSETARYATEYICTKPIKELYSFAVSDEVLPELEHIGNTLIKQITGQRFKSLDLLMS